MIVSMDIENLKKNPKTTYLASEYERLMKQEAETTALIEHDSAMADMAIGTARGIPRQRGRLREIDRWPGREGDLFRAEVRDVGPCRRTQRNDVHRSRLRRLALRRNSTDGPR